MSPALLSITSVREELWRSLVSMLRVYASAANLSRAECALTEISPETVLVVSRGSELTLNFSPESGHGSWKLRRSLGGESRGAFHLFQDGTLQLRGAMKELDQAAIEWIEDLTPAEGQPGSRFKA